MATDLRGHTVPASTDHPSRAGWVLNPLMSVRDPIPVANMTARAALIVALAAASPAVVPSTANPIWVFRADAPVGNETEYTVDGTNFTSVRGRIGARVQMSNGGIPTTALTALGPDATLKSGSVGFTRTTVGIQIPARDLLCTIHAHTNLGGAGLPGRAFLEVVLSAHPIGITGTFNHRLPMYSESAVSGTVVLPLSSGTVIGLSGYQESSITRTFDGFLTVVCEPLPAGW